MSIQDDIRFAFQKPNNAHIQFIIINGLIFIAINLMMVLGELFDSSFLAYVINLLFMIPSDLDAFLFRPWTAITYAFTHEGFFHILFNMMWLYSFGRLFVDFLGDRRFINLYILGGLAGALLYLISYNTIPTLMARGNGIMIGASASVSAIVVGMAVMSPNYKFNLMFIGPVSIKYLAAFVVISSFFNISGTNAGGNIAHLGGAAMGFSFIKLLQQGTDLGKPLNSLYDFVNGLFNPSRKVKVSYRKSDKTKTSTSTTPTFSKTSQKEIDSILDKIAESGYESLSKTEKDKLFNASKD